MSHQYNDALQIDPPLDAADAKTRSRSVEEFKVWLKATKLLGASTIRVDCKSSGNYEAQKRYAAEDLNALCDVAAPMGMDICRGKSISGRDSLFGGCHRIDNRLRFRFA